MQQPISFADIKRAKSLAKTLAAQLPHLSHTQRLDRASGDLFGVRHYHELNTIFERQINSQVVVSKDPNGIDHCRYCDYSFGSGLKSEQKLHRAHHEQFMEAVEGLGYRPGTLVERERLKEAGYQEAAHGATQAERVAGALKVARGWFDRSLSASIDVGAWRKHPTFEAYVAMVMDDLGESFPELSQALVAQFGRSPGVLAAGSSYWSPSKKS